MLVCVIVAHFIVFIIIIKGIRSSGKVVYITATFPYLMLVTLLVRALTLDGAGEGVRLFLVPKFGDLLNPQVWVEASAQVILTLGITYPGLTAFGSYNKFRNDFYKQSIYIVPLGAATSLLMGVVTFSLLGHLSHTQGVRVEDLIQSGPGLVFQIYPVGLSLMPLPQFWSVLFFLMFILVAVDSAFAEFEGIIVGITDAYPIMTSSTKHRALITVIVGIVFCCITMILLTPYGPRIFELVYYYGASTITLLWLALFESIALGWFWNANKFSCDVKTMTGRRLPKLFEISFRFIIPTVIMAIFCFYCSQWRPLSVGEYIYPTWANVIGWCLAASSMLCIPIGAFVFLWKQEGNLKQKWLQAFQYHGTTLVPQSDYTDTPI
ncbi:sodium- and chloride-dependent betaine transporter-like [Ciona intestinalis]